MDKVWMYVGGIIVAAAILGYAALTMVKTTHPPATDLRAAYEHTK